MALDPKYKLLYPEKDKHGKWKPIPKEKFMCWGYPARNMKTITGKLYNKVQEEIDGKLLQHDIHRWRLFFEGYSKPPYTLVLEYTLWNGHSEKDEDATRVLKEKERKHKGPVTILYPADDESVPCTFYATGQSTIQGTITGTITKGSYLQEGVTTMNPGLTGLWCIEFTNVTIDSGYTVRVEIAGDGDTSERVTVTQ